MSKITLHNLENRSIELLISYIDKLVPIKNHASFPEIKTQIILSSGSNNWIYVRETSEQIKKLIAESKKILGKN